MNCKYCNKPLHAGAAFCAACGKSQTEVSGTDFNTISLAGKATSRHIGILFSMLISFGILLFFFFQRSKDVPGYVDSLSEFYKFVPELHIYIIIALIIFIIFGIFASAASRVRRESKKTGMALNLNEIIGVAKFGKCSFPYSNIVSISILPEPSPILNLMGFSNHTIKICTSRYDYVFPYIYEPEKVVFAIQKRMADTKNKRV